MKAKLSPSLATTLASLLRHPSAPHLFLIQSTRSGALADSLQALPATAMLRRVTADLILVKTNYDVVQAKILSDTSVHFVDIIDREVHEEQSIAGFDNTLNTINSLQALYPSFTANGLSVSVKENRPDTADIDFSHRLQLTEAASGTLSTHATIMTTIIAGAGNSFYNGRGVATAANITSSSFDVLLPDNDDYYAAHQISVQNHSYGTAPENYYGADAAAYDASVLHRPSLLHVFSAGNAGTSTNNYGTYAGIATAATITGSFKMAKNITTVGAVDSFGNIALQSSRGPAYDGRIKPELLAFAEDGSSGAAALVSGTALILQDIYKQRYHTLPDAALVKALLLNTATDVGAKGPDFSSGFGNLDAFRAAKEMMAGRFFAGALASGAQTSFRLDLPANARNLKILLAWSDPPAAPNAPLALVNDLDLTVTDMSIGQPLFPLTLNASPQADSLALPARNMPDHLNTQEQVVIENPAATAYMINVKANTIEGSSQSFFVTYQWDTTGSLQWTYPLAPDNVFSAKKNLLRWKTTMAGNAQLAYRWIGNSEWRTISTIDLSKGYVYWQAPDTNALAQLRIITETTNFTSDTIRISAPLLPMVGYDCTDSALLYWNNAKAPGYRLYALGERYMEPVQSIMDTMAFIDKRLSHKLWYSVAPLLGYGKTGVQSRAVNYTTQGISCYVKKFTADLNGSNALLSVEMGSSYLLSAVQIEKRQPDGSFVPIQNVNGLLALRFNITDPQLQQGENVYRARILLSNGQSIYSAAESVFYLAGQSYLVYPTPVQRPLQVTITAAQLANQQVNFYNATGQLVYHTIMRNLSVQLPTARFLPGLYFYSIFNAGKREAAGTIIIQ